MTFNFKTMLASAAILLGSAAIASAAPASVTSDLNMRAGPGTGYGVVTVLPAGAVVDVIGCTGSWCRVSWRGISGYASASYLASGGPVVRRAPVIVSPPRVVIHTPYWNSGFYHWHDGRVWHRDRDDRRWRDWDRRRGGDGDRHRGRDRDRDRRR